MEYVIAAIGIAVIGYVIYRAVNRDKDSTGGGGGSFRTDHNKRVY